MLDSLKVSDIQLSTRDCVIVSLIVPKDKIEQYSFLPGQYLTVEADIAGKPIRRSYSICSTKDDIDLKIGIKKVQNGVFSTYANTELKIGDTLKCLPPMGKFTTKKSTHHVFFAAGSGITPIFSMIASLLEDDKNVGITLFYVNQTVGSIILKEELEALKNEYLEQLNIHYFLTRQSRSMPLFDGRLDDMKLEELRKAKMILLSPHIEYYACGPEAMIVSVKDFLIQNGISANKIHFELFYAQSPSKKSASSEHAEEGRITKVYITEGGKTYQFKMTQGADSILDAALNQGADLPYACKGGVCSTCRARVLKGEVEMLLSYGLEQEEINDGYVLTCQSYPQSEEITIDFDD